MKALYAIMTVPLLAANFLASPAALAHDGRDGRGDNNEAAMAVIQNQADRFETSLTGSGQVPAVVTDTTGRFKIRFDMSGAMDTARITLKVRNGMGITAAHLHFGGTGTNGPIIVSLFDNPAGINVDGRLARFTITSADILPAGRTLEHPITNLTELMRAMERGEIYVNVHSLDHPAGLIRGQVMPGEKNFFFGINRIGRNAENDREGRD